MTTKLTQEQNLIAEAARDFAQNYLATDILDRDKKELFPSHWVKQMAELGFMGMMVSPAYEGSGMDTLSYVMAMEEISKVDASTAVIMSVNNSLVCWGLETYGDDYQKNNYLKDLASGRKLGAFCLSEPEAGSDAAHLKTRALDKGAYFELTGTKNWITNGSTADLYLVMAQTDPALGHKGISCFIVEKGMEGFEIGPKEDKLGIRSSDTHSLLFNQVKVPKENLVGGLGFGFKFAMETINGGRIGIAAQALGIAQGAYEHSLAYSKERKTFGKPISEHQAIQFKLAKMKTDIEAARTLVYKAARLKDAHQSFDVASAMAKYYASKVAMEVTVEAVQIHGGNGYVRAYHVERMMRDAKITQIYEGTSEIQLLVIARSLLN
jgi:alkylation response protein AidB-like acyl-CoA dehydrogenase